MKEEPVYYTAERINGRIDSYVAGVVARHDGHKASVNPHERGSEQFDYWRNGYLEAPMYWTGGTKLFLVP